MTTWSSRASAIARSPASGVRRSWLTQATSSRRLASRARSRFRAWARRSWAAASPSDSPASSAGSGIAGGMYRPLSPTFCTDVSSCRLAFVSFRLINRATANPARPAMAISSSMTSRSPELPTMMTVMPPIPAMAVTTVTAEMSATIAPMERRAIARSATIPMTVVTAPTAAEDSSTCSRSEACTPGMISPGAARTPGMAADIRLPRARSGSPRPTRSRCGAAASDPIRASRAACGHAR